MTLSFHLGYLKTILVHHVRRQSFAGKSDSTFYNIWDLVILHNFAGKDMSGDFVMQINIMQHFLMD